MGLFKGIGKVFKSVGGILGKVARGVMKFASSPLGKMLIGAGLTFLTGGAGGAMLGKLMGGLKLGKLGGIASKFLGSAKSLLSKSGLQTAFNLFKQAKKPMDIFNSVKDLMSARKATPQPAEPAYQQVANYNVAQLAAYQQARVSGHLLGA